MRFCMVTTFYPPDNFGGDGHFVRGLSRALVRRGHQVEVVHCADAYRLLAGASGSEPPHAGSPDDGITVHRLTSRFGPLSPIVTQQTGMPGLKASRLRSVFDRGFDVVNFHNVSLVGGPGVLRMAQAPVKLYTLHEHWLICPAHILWKNNEKACDGPTCLTCCLRSGRPPQLWRYSGLVRRSLEQVDQLLSPSQFTANQHIQAGIEAPIQVLPTFPNFVPQAVQSHRRPGRPTFVFVGRVTATKGVEQLLRDFAPLTNYDLHIVGDGDLRERLEREYAGLAHIRFVGKVPQAALPDVYCGATAIILSSLAPEVFPLTILEAFACGTPAIVRDVGGSREPVDLTGGGLVYRTRDEFLSVVRRLAEDPALRQSMSEKARLGYETNYTEDIYVDRYLQLIDDIRRRKPSGSTLEPRELD